MGGGKIGCYQTVYVYGGTHIPLFLLTIFAKNEKDNLTKAELTAAVELSKALVSKHMNKACESIREGLNEALAFARGEDTGALMHHIEVPNVDVAKIRASTGLSQTAFARSIGVAKGTLLNWEHGRRRPTGPARVLLAMIARKPSLVKELLQN
jgi:putative transcriptional regulator